MTSVLFVRLSAMGDLVQSLGAVAALLAQQPETRATIVTQAPLVPLLQGFPGLRRVVGFRRDGGWRGLRQVRDQLREDAYDVALDLQGNWKSAAIAFLSGARRRIGARGVGRREPCSQWLLHRAVHVEGAPHPARVAWELVRTIEPRAAFVAPRLVATVAERRSECEALAAVGVDPRRPFQLVVVTDPVDPRALRPETVALVLCRGDMPAVQLMGPAESALTPMPGVACVRHGPDEVRRLIALGEVVAAAGGRVLGPDQGAMHVLAAAGADCTVMFGAQDPRRTAPPMATALVHPVPPACSPCRLRRCTHPSGPVCMQFDPAAGREVANELPSRSR